MKDLYEVLGLDKDSKIDIIKSKYRELANKYHPDKESGNIDKFKEVKLAYEILSDEERRNNYDKFGEEKHFNEVYLKEQSLQMACTIFSTILEGTSENRDLISVCLGFLSTSINNINSSKRTLNTKLTKFKLISKRLKRKRKSNNKSSFEVIVDGKILELERELFSNSISLKVHEGAISVFNEYEYDIHNFDLQLTQR